MEGTRIRSTTISHGEKPSGLKLKKSTNKPPEMGIRSKSLSNVDKSKYTAKRKIYSGARRISMISIPTGKRKRSASTLEKLAPSSVNMNRAAKEGNLKELMQARNNDEEWNHHTYAAAAAGGHLDIIQYLRKKGCSWDIETTRASANGGHLDTLKWVLSKGCKIDSTIFNGVIRNGKVDIVIWLHDHYLKYCLSEIRHNVAAVKSGNLDMVKLLRKWKYPWSDIIGRTACALGKLDIIKWLYDNKSSLPNNACQLAAKHGHLNTLIWLHNNTFDLGNSALEAARNGYLESLVWIYEQLKILPDTICAAAANGGNLSVLRWLINHGYTCNHEVLDAAIEGGNIEIIEWIISHISILELLPPNIKHKDTDKDRVKIFTPEHCTMAAKSGNIILLKWLRGHGCKWDEDTTCVAAMNGKLEILQYAKEQGCPIDIQTCLITAEVNKHTHITDWLTDTMYYSIEDSSGESI